MNIATVVFLVGFTSSSHSMLADSKVGGPMAVQMPSMGVCMQVKADIEMSRLASGNDSNASERSLLQCKSYEI